MSYQDWRRTVPFTDEQIALAHDSYAALFERDGNSYMANRHRYRAGRCRAGFVSGRDVAFALDFMVKHCDICGKKALYRTGIEGRCSAHRKIPAAAVRARLVRIEEKQTEFEKMEKERRKAELAAKYFNIKNRRFGRGISGGLDG